MRTKKFFSVLVMIVTVFSAVSVWAAEDNIAIYFEPKVMNDVTGELEVDVNILNYDTSMYISYGSMYHIGFSFTYDTDAFDVINNADGETDIRLNENSLIKSADAVSVNCDDENGRVDFEFSVPKTGDDLIGNDGTLFTFSLKSTEVSKFWNSFDTYPMRFVQGTIDVRTYDYLIGKEYTLDNVLAYDCNVASYNEKPSLTPKSVKKKIEFSAGSNTVTVDGEEKEIDAGPYEKDGILMVPLRYLAENAEMSVEWNEDEMLAVAYAEYVTLKVSASDKSVYVNNRLINTSVVPEEVADRIYVPIDLIKDVCSGAVCSTDGNKVSVYVP